LKTPEKHQGIEARSEHSDALLLKKTKTLRCQKKGLEATKKPSIMKAGYPLVN
jgi:hypothetical protein